MQKEGNLASGPLHRLLFVLESVYMVKYIGSKEAAAKWGLTDRQVRILCGKGYVIGAIQTNKWVWCIPDDAPRPVDGRMARRYEQRNIRLGSIDITLLNALRAGNGLGDKLFTNQAFQGQLASLFIQAHRERT